LNASHKRQIICGAWSKGGLLALAAEDRSLSVSNSDGDTLKAVALRAEPSLLRFGKMKTEDKPNGDDTVRYCWNSTKLSSFDEYSCLKLSKQFWLELLNNIFCRKYHK